MISRNAIASLIAASLFEWMPAGHAQTSPANQAHPVLTQISRVRRLTPERARERLPVRLRVVVTYFDAINMFVQDSTGGIWVGRAADGSTAKPGQLLELRGVTTQTDFAQDIIEPRWTVIGQAALPKARRASTEELASTTLDSELVEVEGILRSAEVIKDGRVRFVLQMPGGRMAGYIPEHDGVPPGLVDSRVRVRGVCGALFNSDNQIVGVNLFVSEANKIQTLEAALPDSFALATWPIGNLQRFNLSGIPRHRLKVRGVTAQFAGSDLYIADPSGSVYVMTSQAAQLKPGDRIEAVGFDGFQDCRPVVQDAIYRIEGSGAQAAAVAITANQGVNDQCDSKLVMVKGLLHSLSTVPEGEMFILDQGGTVFSAILRTQRTDPALSLRTGSLLQLTGICLVDKDATGAVQSFKLRLRSIREVLLIDGPSWWTRGRALAVMSMMIAITVTILVWLVILRRQVTAQTQDLLVKTVKLELAHHTTQEALRRAQEAESLEVDRRRVLQLVACDEPIEQILDQLAAAVAVHCPGAVCAILLNLPEGRHLSSVPALHGDWQDVLKRIEITSISAGSESRGLGQFSSDPAWERLLETHPACRFQNFGACPIPVKGRLLTTAFGVAGQNQLHIPMVEGARPRQRHLACVRDVVRSIQLQMLELVLPEALNHVRIPDEAALLHSHRRETTEELRLGHVRDVSVPVTETLHEVLLLRGAETVGPIAGVGNGHIAPAHKSPASPRVYKAE